MYYDDFLGSEDMPHSDTSLLPARGGTRLERVLQPRVKISDTFVQCGS